MRSGGLRVPPESVSDSGGEIKALSEILPLTPKHIRFRLPCQGLIPGQESATLRRGRLNAH